MALVGAHHFHPICGHVEDGNTVFFSDGRRLTIKSVTGGWALIDKDGKQVGETADGAYPLTHLIVSLEEGRV